MTITRAHAQAVGPGRPADTRHLLAVHVSSSQLTAAAAGARPEAAVYEHLGFDADDDPPRLLIPGPSGAGKTSLMLRGSAEATAHPRPLDVLWLRAGASPERLETEDAFVAFMLETMRDQGGFATISDDDLAAAAATSRTRTPARRSRDVTIDARVVKLRTQLDEAVTSLTEDVSASERRQTLEDALRAAAAVTRLVVVIDDTDRFAAAGPDGVDRASISNLFRNGVAYVSDLPAAVLVAIHPVYEQVEAVRAVELRHGFSRVPTPMLPVDAGTAPLRQILDRRLDVAAIDAQRGLDLFDPDALAVLQAAYFDAARHDLRRVLRLCQASASAAVDRAAGRVQLVDVQEALDRDGAGERVRRPTS